MKNNIIVEAENNELVLKNKEGDYVIIPKKYRTEVQGMIKDGCHGCIDKLVETLPVMADYADDGSLLPSWDKIKSTVKDIARPIYHKYKKLTTPDYSDKGNRHQAYAAAKKAGEKEFLFNGERFNTKSDMTPKQQMNVYGITDEQTLSNNFLRNRLARNIKNEYTTGSGKITEPIGRVFDAVIMNKSEKGPTEIYGNILPYYDPYGDDALNLYLGKPQKYNNFGVSDYKPTITKNNDNPIYYKISNDNFVNNILQEFSKDPNRISFQMDDRFGMLGTFTVSKGKDEKGDYISYYDIYDINPYKGEYSRFNSKKGDISMGIGKPFEVYDRIYYTEDINLKNKKEIAKKEYDKLRKKQDEYNAFEENFNIPEGFTYYEFRDLSDDNYSKLSKIQDEICALDRAPKYRRQYYSDKELSELDPDKRNFDTLALQRELSNRGYKLPKSTKQDGSFDGIWGDETKNALLDYKKSQNKLEQ